MFNHYKLINSFTKSPIQMNHMCTPTDNGNNIMFFQLIFNLFLHSHAVNWFLLITIMKAQRVINNIFIKLFWKRQLTTRETKLWNLQPFEASMNAVHWSLIFLDIRILKLHSNRTASGL